MMAAALKLIKIGDVSRDLYLFDTFEGLVFVHKTLYIHSVSKACSGRSFDLR